MLTFAHIECTDVTDWNNMEWFVYAYKGELTTALSSRSSWWWYARLLLWLLWIRLNVFVATHIYAANQPDSGPKSLKMLTRASKQTNERALWDSEPYTTAVYHSSSISFCVDFEVCLYFYRTTGAQCIATHTDVDACGYSCFSLVIQLCHRSCLTASHSRNIQCSILNEEEEKK